MLREVSSENAQAGGVEQFEDGVVAQMAPAGLLGGVQDGGDFTGGECLRKALFGPGHGDHRSGVGLGLSGADEVTVEGAQCGEVALDGALGEPPRAEGGEVGPDEERVGRCGVVPAPWAPWKARKSSASSL